jgi:NAD(P)H dehydrogenase (quinone)
MTRVGIAIAYHSGYGHTERQAVAVAEGVDSVAGARAERRSVATLDDSLWSTLAEADAIVFGAPTYMGSQSAVFQAFAEASARVWADQGWKDKLAAGFTNSAGLNGDKLNTLTSLAVLAVQHGMHWINLGLPPGWLFRTDGSPADLNRLGGFLGAMAQSPSDAGPEIAPPESDLETSRQLGRRVAQVALQIARGRTEPALVLPTIEAAPAELVR